MNDDPSNFKFGQSVIAKWGFNWADEFNVVGTTITTKGETSDVREMARALDNIPPSKELWEPVPSPVFNIGTNQEKAFKSYSEMFDEVKIIPILFYHKVYVEFLRDVVTHDFCPIYDHIQNVFMDYLADDDDLVSLIPSATS